MAEAGNSNSVSPPYSMATHTMSNMEPVSMSGNMTPPQIETTTNQVHRQPILQSLNSLAPIFPPQNFEVPDISFSNSVSPNSSFGHSHFTSMLLQSEVQPSPATTATTVVPSSPLAHLSMTGTHSNINVFAATTTNSVSPNGTSSSDDSDDVPLAQLVGNKRAAPTTEGTGSPGSSTITASPSLGSLTTTSNEGTDSTPSPVVAPKKAKPSKRKKKKDPNEPQKPVSAYALFFRDTQATIKGHNPSASFGEVSKIVASMWDQLDPETKDVYKKKTEMAKKQYLKQLAAYRASQVSQSAGEDPEKASSPNALTTVSPSMTTGAMMSVMQAPPLVHTVGPPPAQVMTHMAPVMMPQQQPPQMMQMTSQMMQQQQQHMQQQFMHQQHQMHMQQHPQMNMMTTHQSSPSPPQQQHSPIQQQMMPAPHQQSPVGATMYNSPPHTGMTHQGYQAPHAPVDHVTHPLQITDDLDLDMVFPTCTRTGCANQARENPGWDAEYCSSECVITHCRDVFTNWAAARSGTNTFPVK